MQPMQPAVHAASQDWATPLCVCCNDGVELCCAATWCPCVVVGTNTMMLDTGNSALGPCSGAGNKACLTHGLLVGAGAIVNTILQGACAGTGWACLQNFTNCPAAAYSSQVSRHRTRTRFNIPKEGTCVEGGKDHDLLCHFCCMPCNLCQEHVEIKTRLLAEQGVVYVPGGGPAGVHLAAPGRQQMQMYAVQGQVNPYATQPPAAGQFQYHGAPQAAQGNPYATATAAPAMGVPVAAQPAYQPGNAAGGSGAGPSAQPSYPAPPKF